MPGGTFTTLRNSVRCVSLVYQSVTNAAWFSDSQDHLHVEDDREYSFLFPWCNLYLKHFKLLGSPRRCITGAQSGSLGCRTGCALLVSHNRVLSLSTGPPARSAAFWVESLDPCRCCWCCPSTASSRCRFCSGPSDAPTWAWVDAGVVLLVHTGPGVDISRVLDTGSNASW